MHLVFALPTPAETGSGGGAQYIGGLVEGLRTIGIQAELLVGDDPAFPPGSIPVIDGMLLPRLRARRDDLVQADAMVVIHHVGAAAGRDEASRADILSAERDMLPRFRRVVATSAPVAERVRSEFGVAAHALPPGIGELAPADPDPAAPLILSVGVFTRRKGHDRLLRAVARLTDLPWRLVIAGDDRREPGHAGELARLADELGLADRATILSDPDPAALERDWRRASVFASATSWEGYPTAVAEAVCRGIPVVVTAGANAEPLLPPEAGAICPLDDMPTFGKCLRRLLFDNGLRADMAAAARSAGEALPRWPDRAREFAAFMEQPR